MTGFNNLPRVRGDTDDEASIHPFRQVGPAQPLPYKRSGGNLDQQSSKLNQKVLPDDANMDVDRYISQILSDPGNKDVRSREFPRPMQAARPIPNNTDFIQYQNSGKIKGNYVSDVEFDTSDSHNGATIGRINEEDQIQDEIDEDQINTDESDEDDDNNDARDNPYISDDDETARESEDDDDSEYKQHQLNKLSPSRLRSNSPINSSKPNSSLFQQLRRVQENETDDNRHKQKPTKGKPSKKRKNHNRSSVMNFLGHSDRESNPLIYGKVLLISFVFSLILILVMSYPPLPKNSHPKPIESFKDITSRFQTVETRVDKLTELTTGLASKQQLLESRHDSLTSTLNTRFNYISTRFDEISQTLALNNNSQYEALLTDLNELKSKFNNFETLSADPEALEPKLNDIASKISKLSQINDNIESIKSDIFEKLIASLPGQVPVYIKDHKIHYIPEFHKYLYTFIENYYNEKQGSSEVANSTISWDKFIATNGIKLNNYIDSTLKNNNFKSVSKDSFETILHKKLLENNRVIWQKFNNLIDNLNLNTNSTSIDITKTSNKILLDNLLDVFAKGSIKINYADYKLGSRILGFLTNTGHDLGNKPLSRKLFLGWYDYLSSNGLKSPKNWKFNANNLLIDGGDYWECESNVCTFGVRLFNPVILTDIFFKTPLTNIPSTLTPPNRVSIYVKPKNSNQVKSLIEYLNNFKINFKASSFRGTDNKYLTKFIKIKEVGLDPTKPINHVKLPVSLINLRVPVKDIYVEISSPRGTNTGFYSFKAYGISEYNSYKYSDEFDLLLNKLYDQQQEEYDREHEETSFEDVTHHDHEEFDVEEFVLGDDEIIF